METRESIIKRIQEIEDNYAKNQREMHAEIGHFVCATAEAESQAHTLFEFVSGLDNKSARAVIGGSRLTDVLSIVQRLTENSKLHENEKKEIFLIISQLREISQLRNFICHSGASVGDEGKFSSWNLHTAKTIESVKILESDLKQLNNATTDAHCISFRITRLTNPSYRKTFEEIPEKNRKAILGAWRYKFAEPKNLVQRAHRKKDQKH
jgi:hypothetical protein